jgi:VanZ family protein
LHKSLQQTSTSWLFAIGWLVICTILFTLPGSAFPKENWLSRIWIDKWVHVGIFISLMILWSRVYLKRDLRNPKKILLLIAMFLLIYGVCVELIQHYFIPNRSFDWGDIIADAGGVVIGYLYSSYRYIKK